MDILRKFQHELAELAGEHPVEREQSAPEGEPTVEAAPRAGVGPTESQDKREADLLQARKAGAAAGRRVAEHDLEYGRAQVKHFTLLGSKKAKEASHEARKAAGKFFDAQWEMEYRQAFDEAYKAVLTGRD